MGRLIMEMLGRDLQVLSIKKVSPELLHIRIEDTDGEHSMEINVNFEEFIELFNSLISTIK